MTEGLNTGASANIYWRERNVTLNKSKPCKQALKQMHLSLLKLRNSIPYTGGFINNGHSGSWQSEIRVPA